MTKRSARTLIAATSAAILLGSCQPAVQPAPLVSPTSHPAADALAEAQKAAGDSPWLNQTMVLCSARPSPDHIASLPNLEPTRAADNLYYLGNAIVSAWAIDTGQGIVLIDVLGTPEDAELRIVKGLKAFGLDPANITDIVITHGHWDHVGGLSAVLAAAPKARTWIGEADIASAKIDAETRAIMRKQGLTALTEDSKLESGGETFDLVMTPGHSPGTVSLIFPVRSGGKSHRFALIGGSATNSLSIEEHLQNDRSLSRFAALAREMWIDGVLSNHPSLDGSQFRLRSGAAVAPDITPYVTSQDEIDRWFTIFRACNQFQMKLK